MGMLGSVNTGGFSEASKAAMMNSDYFNRPQGISRFAGGFADFLTGNRFDFDKRGKNDEDKEGMFDTFLEGGSYRPDKRSDTDQLLAMASQRAGGLGMGGGSFQDIGGGVTMFNPSNTARNQAIALRNQQTLMAQQRKEEQKSNIGRMAGAAIGSAFGPVGSFLGGAIGGIFCDIRLKEDIAPLCKSEVNDVLSECAFFVKDLNECS
jgi:hypothetical protein